MLSTLDMMEVDEAALEVLESTLSQEMCGLVNQVFPNVGSLLALGREFVLLGETQDALDCFGRALKEDPSCWQAYVERADVVHGLLILGDEPGNDASLASWACSDLEMALGYVDADNRGLVLRLLLTARLVAGRFNQVKALADSILHDGSYQDADERNDVIYSLGFAEMFLGDSEEALRCFRSLPSEYEAGLFGEAVCQLRCRNDGDVRSPQSQLSRRYEPAFDFLLSCDVSNYLDVARALCVVDLGSQISVST